MFGHPVLRTYSTGARWVALTNRTIAVDLMPQSPIFAASARTYSRSLPSDLKPVWYLGENFVAAVVAACVLHVATAADG